MKLNRLLVLIFLIISLVVLVLLFLPAISLEVKKNILAIYSVTFGLTIGFWMFILNFIISDAMDRNERKKIIKKDRPRHKNYSREKIGYIMGGMTYLFKNQSGSISKYKPELKAYYLAMFILIVTIATGAIYLKIEAYLNSV